MKTIGIIGGGFSGTMAAVQLVENSSEPLKIVLINKNETLNRGIAYNPYSNKHLLNVITSKMSAFPDKPDHFLDWVMGENEFKMQDRALVANAFLPRSIYGEYLEDIWQNSLTLAADKSITIEVINKDVLDIDVFESHIVLHLENDTDLTVNECVIASGNQIPRNPRIKDTDFYKSKNYFRNPWGIESVSNLQNNSSVLIIGNGLTMVDTVLGLLEQGFKGEIYSISPNGFNILPHRHNGMKYSKLTDELRDDLDLHSLVKLVNKHIKAVRNFGVSAEPVIDSLRPHTQNIWKRLSVAERLTFMSKLRHLWGVARHRIPLHTHDKIQQLRIDNKLHIYSGKLLDINEEGNDAWVTYFNKSTGETQKIKVARVINCTGPETDLLQIKDSFLHKCLLKGIIKQDNLKLGIVANTDTFEIINAENKPISNLFTLGSNLKGELWESTAVNELRTQAKKLAENITSRQTETAKENALTASH